MSNRGNERNFLIGQLDIEVVALFHPIDLGDAGLKVIARVMLDFSLRCLIPGRLLSLVLQGFLKVCCHSQYILEGVAEACSVLIKQPAYIARLLGEEDVSVHSTTEALAHAAEIEEGRTLRNHLGVE